MISHQITFSRKHHYWGMQSGLILEGTLTECQAHKRLLDSLFPDWQFEISFVNPPDEPD